MTISLLVVVIDLMLWCCPQEFDPEQFYMLLEAAEGQARQTIKADIPQYIISKLGLAGTDTLTGSFYSTCSISTSDIGLLIGLLHNEHLIYMKNDYIKWNIIF